MSRLAATLSLFVGEEVGVDVGDALGETVVVVNTATLRIRLLYVSAMNKLPTG